MWGRLAACAAVGYRRCPVQTRRAPWVGPIDNRPQLTKLPHNSAPCLVYAYTRFTLLCRAAFAVARRTAIGVICC
jgi:hypothetical protein